MYDKRYPVRSALGIFLMMLLLPVIVVAQWALKPKPWGKIDIATSYSVAWLYDNMVRPGRIPDLGFVNSVRERELAMQSIEAHAFNEKKLRGYNGQSNRPKRAHD